MSRILYLGLDVPEHKSVIHCPLIKIVPRPIDNEDIKSAFSAFQAYTHVIFTSKNAVSIFMEYAAHFGIELPKIADKYLIAVGSKTAAKMAAYGLNASAVANEETGEGVVKILESLKLSHANILWPHSALSRPVITDWLTAKSVPHTSLPLYNTEANIPKKLPNLEGIDEIIFTSPSTVDAFLLAYGKLPNDKKLSCIGPITQAHLSDKMRSI